MPAIRPSSDLRNKYSEISAYCQSPQAPVFITKNGVGDLAVMRIEACERLVGLQTLRAELVRGLQDIRRVKMESGMTISVFQKMYFVTHCLSILPRALHQQGKVHEICIQ